LALTDTKIRSLKPTGKRYELPDRDGLVLRVSQSGAMSWAVSFRVRAAGSAAGTRVAALAGIKRRVTLGNYPTLSLADARKRAAEIKLQAKDGTDPAAKPTVRQKADTSVASLVDRYCAAHLSRNLRSGANVEKLLRLHIVPAWGEQEVASISRADLVGLLEAVRVPSRVKRTSSTGKTYKAKRGGPGAAAEVRKWARALFQYGVDVAMIDRNPFDGVRNADKQRARSRVLSMEEARTAWKVACGTPYPFGPYFQLLILTGARRNEWAAAQRSWLDGDVTRLEIPTDQYKSDRPHVVPLGRRAKAVVDTLLLEAIGPYLMSTTGGARPISGFSKAKAEVDKAITEAGLAVKPWVVHDLRRTMATHMERIGIAPHIIELCLGHSLKGVAAVYRQYQYLPERLAALEAWADELAAANTTESHTCCVTACGCVTNHAKV
jgi:integrase